MKPGLIKKDSVLRQRSTDCPLSIANLCRVVIDVGVIKGVQRVGPAGLGGMRRHASQLRHAARRSVIKY